MFDAIRSRGRAVVAAGVLFATSSHAAQSYVPIPPMLQEAELDRRFMRSRVQGGLKLGSGEVGCVQLLSGLLTVYAETAPLLHKQDTTFFVDAPLQTVLDTQLSTPEFRASDYLVAMFRRTLIDGRVPQSWLETAERLNSHVRVIDLSKLRFLADAPPLIDDFRLTLPVLRERYVAEVKKATSVSAPMTDVAFRDTYVDRLVAWDDLVLVDVKTEKAKSKKKTNGTFVALLEWHPVPVVPDRINPWGKKPKKIVVKLTAHLSPKQYVDVLKLPKGQRVLVRGRLWDFKGGVDSVELRDALLFEDRDWSRGAVLANPAEVMQCPLAVNELSGGTTLQPGGFGHR